MKDLRVVFMGTPDFAVASLRSLVDAGVNVVGVITPPDRPAGRGKKLSPSAVKSAALELEIPVLQPPKLKDEEFLNELRALKADLQIVVAFRMLPEVVWNMPEHGTFNLHGSLLPNYRGAAPINWAVMNGDDLTGVTTFLLNENIDTGAILFREFHPIAASDTAGDVHDALMEIGAGLVVKTYNAIASGNINPIDQDTITDSVRNPAPKIFKADCEIDWNSDIHSIYNRVRGLSPYPTAWSTMVMGEKQLPYKIFFGIPVEEAHNEAPGSIATDGSTFLKVYAKDGYLQVTELQAPGKKRMGVADFLRGAKIESDWKMLTS